MRTQLPPRVLGISPLAPHCPSPSSPVREILSPDHGQPASCPSSLREEDLSGLPCHLRDSRLENNVADGLGGSAQHGDHHHQHVRAPWQWVPSKVEEDAEAMLVINCHRQDAACGEKG